jgi:hypothetical protein
MKVREEFLKETAFTTSSVTFRVFSGQFFKFGCEGFFGSLKKKKKKNSKILGTRS